MNFTPEDTNIYNNNQIIINSDRLIFNAKQDSILFSSNKIIGFNTNGSFHFDSEKNFIVNSKIFNCRSVIKRKSLDSLLEMILQINLLKSLLGIF